MQKARSAPLAHASRASPNALQIEQDSNSSRLSGYREVPLLEGTHLYAKQERASVVLVICSDFGDFEKQTVGLLCYFTMLGIRNSVCKYSNKS